MPKSITLAGYAAAALLALLLFRSCDASARASERYAIERARSDSVIASLTAEASRRDTVFRRDTVRLTRWRTAYDTARVTDTVVVDSVVYIPREIADSTIRACTLAVGSCAAARQADAAVIDGLRQRIALESKRGTCKVAGFIPCPTRTQSAIAGAVVGAVVVGAVTSR
jgi:hypothetical protein